MLKHEDSLQAPPQPAAQVRVTPEELAAAISRLEARKDASQRQAEGTVAIGEVVQQLGLDATPDEVLAEVQAGRQHATPKRRASAGRRFMLLLGLSGILLGLWLDGNGLLQILNQQTETSVSVSNTPRPISLAPNLMVGDLSGKLMMFSEVSDDQPVHCTFDLESGYFIYFSPSNRQAWWTLIKHNGKIYVRGRTLRMSPKVFSSEGADVTNLDDDPQFAAPVTLPLDAFQILPNTGSDYEFHAVNVHLDKYAHEKWQP